MFSPLWSTCLFTPPVPSLRRSRLPSRRLGIAVFTELDEFVLAKNVFQKLFEIESIEIVRVPLMRHAIHRSQNVDCLDTSAQIDPNLVLGFFLTLFEPLVELL